MCDNKLVRWLPSSQGRSALLRAHGSTAGYMGHLGGSLVHQGNDVPLVLRALQGRKGFLCRLMVVQGLLTTQGVGRNNVRANKVANGFQTPHG